MTRPKRKHIPIAVKRDVAARQDDHCQCGCGKLIRGRTPCANREVWANGIHWDHEPALRLRDVNRRGTDYIPRQNDPKYLVARCVVSHRIKTIGDGISRKRSMAGTDMGKIKKERRRTKKEQMIARLAKRGPWPKVRRKLQSRPFQKRKVQ